MTYSEEYRARADEMAFVLETLARNLRERGPAAVADGLASIWIGPLMSDLCALAQFAELCRVWDARAEVEG